MRNKRGILVPEVMKIIIAVICITLLIILAVQLYGLFKSKNRIDQANGNLEEMTIRMKELKEGENFEFTLLSPSGYILTGWPITSGSGTNYLPDQCMKNNWQNCLCFCPYTRDQKSALAGFVKHIAATSNYFTMAIVAFSTIRDLASGQDISSVIYETCKADSVCKQVDKKVIVDGSKLNNYEKWFSWENLKNSAANPQDVFLRVLERTKSINVNDLMEFKQPIVISNKNGGYEIVAK